MAATVDVRLGRAFDFRPSVTLVAAATVLSTMTRTMTTTMMTMTTTTTTTTTSTIDKIGNWQLVIEVLSFFLCYLVASVVVSGFQSALFVIFFFVSVTV